MTRFELEHIIRAAGSIAKDSEIIIIGSQSVLGQFPRAPAELLASTEADVFPRNHPERADLIDIQIGEGSTFHQEFGYYAQGVDERAATLPSGWRDRLVRIDNPNTNGIAGLCLEVHDLAVSKYVAAREKDLEFTRELARHRMTERQVLLERLHTTELPGVHRELVAARIARDFATRRARNTNPTRR
ncbi:MAG TPA: DUF6036 family nucleotidyltransferase [Steroidobacteraceae bacterium]|nr:DUF6036 family nucleotidyltransferase [Steroidobacteraceae bacterium]